MGTSWIGGCYLKEEAEEGEEREGMGNDCVGAVLIDSRGRGFDFIVDVREKQKGEVTDPGSWSSSWLAGALGTPRPGSICSPHPIPRVQWEQRLALRRQLKSSLVTTHLPQEPQLRKSGGGKGFAFL